VLQMTLDGHCAELVSSSIFIFEQLFILKTSEVKINKKAHRDISFELCYNHKLFSMTSSVLNYTYNHKPFSIKYIKLVEYNFISAGTL